MGELNNKSGGKDNILLGRYEFNDSNGIPTLKQNADNYDQNVIIKDYFQEKINAPRNLEGFVTKTKANGGYYLARYEASKGSDDRTKSQYDKTVWTYTSQEGAKIYSQDVYRENDYIESDLVNSYAWDTAIVFIQKYSGNSNYANKTSTNLTQLKTGRSGDKACNIYDIASNCFEWSTEYCDIYQNPVTFRGGSSGDNYMGGKYATAQFRSAYMTYGALGNLSFRSILYFI